MRSNHLKINNFKANIFYKPSKTNKMIPGPDIIYKCPKCSTLLKCGSLLSGNTIGACHYSDGKMIAMMMPEYPYITICKKCKKIFWLEEEFEVGTCNAWDESDSLYANVSYANFLSIEEYHRALEIDGIIRKKSDERYICQRISQSLYNER